MDIRFNKAWPATNERRYLSEVLDSRRLAGDGSFTHRCNAWLESETACKRAVLTHSCTAALEMAAILADVGPGDEVIMPSYTFVSTANAFVLRGATPVFVDVRSDTLNLDEALIEAAITPRTRAIVPVHYAGVGCDMDEIMAIAARHDLTVIEDAAQGLLAGYRGKALGAIGALGTVSFHESKNVVSGEGGALLVNEERFVPRAEVIREKGTDRSRFLRGEVDKYTWIDIGSSYLPSELIAAVLFAQLEEAQAITARRISIWNRFHSAFAELERSGLARLPVVPEGCAHNAHIYYLLLPTLVHRTRFVDALKGSGIGSAYHYFPLHASPAGARFGRSAGRLPVTESVAERLVRIPLWPGIDEDQVGAICEAVTHAARSAAEQKR